eukprot:UN28626
MVIGPTARLNSCKGNTIESRVYDGQDCSKDPLETMYLDNFESNYCYYEDVNEGEIFSCQDDSFMMVNCEDPSSPTNTPESIT